jgi:3-phenylpropionate/trans-cinnamate dioxygenase ferredoxin subunit
MANIIIGSVDEFPLGSRRQVTVVGRKIAVFRARTGFFALRDTCPHMGAELSHGTIVGSVKADRPGCYENRPDDQFIRCPWHGWEYELSTGRSWFDPAHNRVAKYATSVVGGGALAELEAEPAQRIKGPYTAESFTIFVENDYVVVEV